MEEGTNVINQHHKDEILQEMSRIFGHTRLYREVIEDKVKDVIEQVNNFAFIDQKTTRTLLKYHFEVANFEKLQTADGDKVQTFAEVVLACVYVLFLSYDLNKKELLFSSVTDLIAHYPSFSVCSHEELCYLLTFRNMMSLALTIIPPNKNKQLVVDIAARLEGRKQINGDNIKVPAYIKYVTGSGQTEYTTRRVQIYYQEGSIPFELQDKKTRETTSFSPVKVSNSNNALGQANGAEGASSSSGSKRKMTTAANSATAAGGADGLDEFQICTEELRLLSMKPRDYVLELIPSLGITAIDPLNNPQDAIDYEDSLRIDETFHQMHLAYSEFKHFLLLMNRPLRYCTTEQYRLCDLMQQGQGQQGQGQQYPAIGTAEEAILKRFYPIEFFSKDRHISLKECWEKMKQILSAARILIYAQTPSLHSPPSSSSSGTTDNAFHFFHTVDELVEKYPQFAGCHWLELSYLLRFRNMMMVGLRLVPGRPKIYLLRVIERLEGADRSYITGKGQTVETDRRVEVYEGEGGELVKPKRKTLEKQSRLLQQEQLQHQQRQHHIQQHGHHSSNSNHNNNNNNNGYSSYQAQQQQLYQDMQRQEQQAILNSFYERQQQQQDCTFVSSSSSSKRTKRSTMVTTTTTTTVPAMPSLLPCRMNDEEEEEDEHHLQLQDDILPTPHGGSAVDGYMPSILLSATGAVSTTTTTTTITPPPMMNLARDISHNAVLAAYHNFNQNQQPPSLLSPNVSQQQQQPQLQQQHQLAYPLPEDSDEAAIRAMIEDDTFLQLLQEEEEDAGEAGEDGGEERKEADDPIGEEQHQEQQQLDDTGIIEHPDFDAYKSTIDPFQAMIQFQPLFNLHSHHLLDNNHPQSSASASATAAVGGGPAGGTLGEEWMIDTYQLGGAFPDFICGWLDLNNASNGTDGSGEERGATDKIGEGA